jgi:hypothetical protein
MASEYACIVCRNKSSEFSSEHFIPLSLIGKPSGQVTISNAVCKVCNTLLGRTVDAAFLNSDLVKLIRLRNKAFLPKDKLPSITIRNAKNLIDLEGNNISLDIVVDASGSRYQPSPKPNEAQPDSSTVFVRSYAEAQALVSRIEGKSIKYAIEPLIPKKALYGPVEIRIERNPPLGILCKMLLEFIFVQYGREKALDDVFDPIRNALLDKAGYDYKAKTIINFPINTLITEKRDSKIVFHTAGLKKSAEFWYFYFTIFDDATFYCSIPFTAWYEQRESRIGLAKY